MIATGGGVGYGAEEKTTILELDPDEKDWIHYILSIKTIREFEKRQVWSMGYATRYDDRYDDFLGAYSLLLKQDQWEKWSSCSEFHCCVKNG